MRKIVKIVLVFSLTIPFVGLSQYINVDCTPISSNAVNVKNSTSFNNHTLLSASQLGGGNTHTFWKEGITYYNTIQLDYSATDRYYFLLLGLNIKTGGSCPEKYNTSNSCSQIATAKLYDNGNDGFLSNHLSYNPYTEEMESIDANVTILIKGGQYGSVKIKVEETKRFWSWDELECVETVTTTYLDLNICVATPSFVFPGNVWINGFANPSQNDIKTITANSSGIANFQFVYQKPNIFCGDITQIKYRKIDINNNPISGWVTANTPNNITTIDAAINANTSGYGVHHFEVRVNSVRNGTNTEHTTNGSLGYTIKNIRVAPSCVNSPTPTISVSEISGGSTVKTVNGGYNTNPTINRVSGYRVDQGKDFIVNFQNITDFSTHYILAQDGGNAGEVQITQVSGNPNQYRVRINAEIGAYALVSTKKDYMGDDCPVPNRLNLYVGGESIIFPTSPCEIVLPNHICDLLPNTCTGSALSDFGIAATMEHFTYQVSSMQSIVVMPGVTLTAGAELIIKREFNQQPEEAVNNNMNWVQNQVYDDYGNLISEIKSFFGQKGQLLQSQAKSLTDGYVMASEPMYDRFGRMAGNTLPAPVRAKEETQAVIDCPDSYAQGRDLLFIYKPNFIQNSAGTKYNFLNFDDTKEFTPDEVFSSAQFTVGWYYSQLNTIEQGVPQTLYPYSRTYYYDNGLNEVRTSVPPGDVYRDLDLDNNVLAFSPNITNQRLTSSDNAIILAYLSVRNSVLEITQNQIEGYKQQVTNYRFDLASVSSDNISGQQLVTNTVYFDKTGNAIITLHGNTGEKSYNIYDLKGRLVAEISPNGVQQLAQGVAFQHIDKTEYRYNFAGELIQTIEPDAGTTSYMYRKDGRIRFSQNAKQALTGYFSYSNYDQIGRLVEIGEYRGTAIVINAQSSRDILEQADGIPSSNKHEVVKYHYDAASVTPPVSVPLYFTRGKVAQMERLDNGLHTTTWFSYDERGRATHTIRKIDMGATNIKTITVEYKYGPASELREIAYQRGQADQFYHYYDYDKDIRLTKVSTTIVAPQYNVNDVLLQSSRDQMQEEASYEYYLHGPLKNVLLSKRGNKHLQKIDYCYTIEGRLKAINQLNLTGSGSSSHLPDVFGMIIDYYAADYISNNTVTNSYDNIGSEFYNTDGNIRAITWNTQGHQFANNAFTYTYDTKNQFKNNSYYNSTNTANNYFEQVNYDPNGNITGLARRIGSGGAAIQSQSYQYNTNLATNPQRTNRLQTMGSSSYAYTAIGELASETGAEAKYYKYNAYSQLVGVYANAAYSQPIAEFMYDETGQRVAKKTFNTYAHAYTTWYMRDMQGNVLSTYQQDAGTNTLAQEEIPIYGMSTLGMAQKNNTNNTLSYYYYITDYLGNIRATITHPSSGSLATVLNKSDYLPYGTPIFKSTTLSSIRKDYQGEFSEKDPETGLNSFMLRDYSSATARWLSIDPMRQHWSPYMSMGNNPIIFVDPDGGKDDDIHVNTKTNQVSVVETNSRDRLFIDGELKAVWANDGDWKYFWSMSEVNYFGNYSQFFSSVHNDKLLNDDFFSKQINVLGTNALKGELISARTRQSINTYGTKTALVSISIPLITIAAAELIGVAAYNRLGIALWKYPNAGGRGLNFLKDGKSVFRIDWHKFKLDGKMVNRPHIDIPKYKIHHWPW